MSAFKNGSGREAVRTVQFRPYADADDVGKGEAYVGLPQSHSIIWTSDDEFTVRVHDGFTPGGHIIAGSGGGGGESIEVTVLDTDSIDFTRTVIGNTRRISGVVRVDPAVDNILTVSGDGLYVPPPDYPAVPDPYGILTLNNGVTANVSGTNYRVGARISPDDGNQLTIRPNGMYVAFAGSSGGEPLTIGGFGFDLESTTSGDIFAPDAKRVLVILPATVTQARFSGFVADDPAEMFISHLSDTLPWSFQVQAGITVDGEAGPYSLSVPAGGGLIVFRTGPGSYSTIRCAFGSSGSSLNLVDSATVDIQTTGGDTTANVLLDTTSGNMLVVSGDGLRARPPVTTADNNIAVTVSASHANAVVMLTNASEPGITIPLASALSVTAYPIGTETMYLRNTSAFNIAPGDAAIVVNGQSSVTYRSNPTPGGIVIKRIGINEWLVLGDCEEV